MAERPSPVELASRRFGIPVLTPKSLRGEEEWKTFAAHGAEAAAVVAYGLILPKPILDAPELGCLNLHASLLPRWRGAAPIQRAVMAGDRESGVAIMRMEEGLDTGPVGLGADAMVRALAALSRGSLHFTPQPSEGVTYAAKIGNEEARIDWHLPAERLHDHVRGLSPFPGAFFEADLGKGIERIKVLRTRLAEGAGPAGTLLDAEASVACGEGALRLETVQRAGRGPVSGADFLRGVRLQPGARLAAG